MRCRLLAPLVLLLICGLSTSAAASYPDTFGLGPRSQGRGGSGTAIPSWESAYYNPGALPFADRELSFGVTYADIDVTLDLATPNPIERRFGEDVSDFAGVLLGTVTPFQLSVSAPPPPVEPLGGQEFYCPDCGTLVDAEAIRCPNPECGAAFLPLVPRERAPSGWRAAFGLALFTPPTLVDIRAESERHPRMVQYEGRTEKLSAHAAFGLELLEGLLALGVGASVLADFESDITLDIQLASDPLLLGSGQDISELSFRAELVVDAAPTAGLFLRLGDSFSLGLAYRGELSLKVDAVIRPSILGLSAGIIEMEAITLFSPQQLTLGASWQATDWLRWSVDASWRQWSAYPGPGPRIVAVDNPFGIKPEVPPDPDFDDIITFSTGVDLSPTDWLVVRTGYGYRPSPAPNPRDPSSIFDSARHRLSAGLGLELGQDVWADVAVIGHWHDQARVRKVSAPGSFTAEARALVVTFGVSLRI